MKQSVAKKEIRPIVLIPIMAVSISVLVALLVEFNRRAGLYWYDVGQDYSYVFDADELTTVPVRIGADGVAVPELPEDWDTAVLSIRLEATLLGAWFEPSIDVTGAGRTWRQTFERSAAGLRYIVVDAGMLQSGGFLNLEGSHIRWAAQQGELLLFSAKPPADGRYLVVAPHPDDAEIAAFGLYSSSEAYIVTVSAGDYVDGLYEHLYSEPVDQNLLRGRVRVWDSLAVPIWGGVPSERVVNLGYPNGSLNGLYDDRESRELARDASKYDPTTFRDGAIESLLGGRNAEGSWQSLVADMKQVVATIKPDVIVTPHPALDAAPDHQYTTLALLEALDELNDRQATLLVYTNHHVLSEYYPYGASDTAVTLPPWLESTPAFGAVFSHRLNDRDRMDKLFALEAMHDLRSPPQVLHGGPTERFMTLVSAAFKSVLRNPLGTYSYMRRAVRDNEIFFVVRSEDRNRLLPGPLPSPAND